MNSNKKNRYIELGNFLKSHRNNIHPSQVGLPNGIRRRTPGLRREEVVQLAGISLTWYTWLKQGRPLTHYFLYFSRLEIDFATVEIET